MFGIIRPCRHRMSEGMAASWLAHLCGLCLALRDGHGQFARVATNYDGLVVSVLTEAQSAPADSRRRKAGPCPLRGMRTAPVATGEGARLAAAVSLVLASAKVRDHVDDADGAFARRPVAAAARGVARRWDRAGTRGGGDLGFDTAVLLDAVGRQGAVEAAAGPGTPLLAVTEPTETATAAAFAHTAVLAGRPANRAPLEEAGRLFGRLAHLLDAVEDLAEDTRTGAWNPLAATGAGLPEARRLCDDALHGIRLALKDVEFANSASGRLAHMLLVHELGRSVDRAFGTGGCAHQAGAPDDGGARGGQDPQGVRGLLGVLGPDGASGNPFGGNPHAGNPYGPGQSPYGPGQSPYAPGPANPYAPGGPGGPGNFPPPEPPRRRGLLAGCLVYTGMCCTCQLCCREHDDAWSGQRRESWCGKCGDCCDCCDGCEICECCECCECCDCGC
ncbi:DUF5685 family protein [Actinacidiphila acidipaludis]|uniref:DUF5685 family protein n=1 Tax=Actinacidiphila acidipaludis TaxID=2873382 RepID=A0ABS7Q5X8_9ACTN|nr:DUF5685 family protein [Streptomyces acidipaludis]MBY8878556.1 DUF5685 family protein [Streptomyces acidipaludis]